MSTPVTDRITRGESGVSPFALVWEEDVRISNVTVDALSDRDTLPEWRRSPKMTCFVRANDTEYRLGNNTTIAGQVWTVVDNTVPDDVLLEGDILTEDGYIKPDLIQNIFLNSSYVVNSEGAMLALTTLTGNFIIRTDTSGIFVKLNNDSPSDLADFSELTYPGAVLSVNGGTGNITITLTSLITGHEATFNTFVAATTVVTDMLADIAALQDALAIFDLDGKADLVSGTVPLSQLPYIFTEGLTRTGSTVTWGGTLTDDGTINAGGNNIVYLNVGDFLVTAQQLSFVHDDLVDYTVNFGNNGVSYASDISGSFGSYSLIHKQYADQRVLGTTLSDPNADRIMFWDDSAGTVAWLTLGTNLTITGTTLDAAGGGSSGTVQGTGVAGRVAYWTASDTIDDDTTLLYNATDNILTSDRYHSSLSADPSGTVTDGDFYYNSTEKDLKIRIASNWANVTRPHIVIDNASTTITLDETYRNAQVYLGASTDITVNAGNLGVGFAVTLYKTGTGNVIFNTGGGTSLDAIDDTIFSLNAGATFIQKSSTKWSGAGGLGVVGGIYLDGSGTTVSGASVNLGGLLTQNAVINGNAGSYAFNLTSLDSMSVDTIGAVTFGVSDDFNVNAVDISLTGTSSATVYSDNNLLLSLAGVVTLSMDANSLDFNGGAVSGNRDVTMYFKRFTGGNNNHTNGGSASFIWGDNNINNGSFGAAMFGELGEIDSSINAFVTGERNYVSAYGAVAQGRGIKVSGVYSWGGGWYSPSGLSGKTNTKAPLISGNGSFGFFETDGSQTVGHGVLAASSAILAGRNGNIPSDSPYSVILGGDGLKARATEPSQVYVPTLNILTVPDNDNTLTQILARDATTGKIKYVNVSSLTFNVNSAYKASTGVTAPWDFANADSVFSISTDTPGTVSNPNIAWFQSRLSTTTTGSTVVESFAVPASSVVYAVVYIVARRTGGSAGTGEDGAAYRMEGVFHTISGTTSAIGTPIITVIGESQAGWDAFFQVQSGLVQIKVSGATNNNISWHVTSKIMKVTD